MQIPRTWNVQSKTTPEGRGPSPAAGIRMGGMAVTEGTVTSVSTVEEPKDNEFTGVTDWVWC